MRGILTFHLIIVLLSLSALEANADNDSISVRHNLVERIIGYFADANKPKADKQFDFSIIGGPHYSSDTKLGIGLVAEGLYRHNIADTVTPPSNVDIYGDVTITGYYKLGIRGHHIFPEEKWRMNYNVYFESNPDKYWGIGYDNADNPDNETDFMCWQSRLLVDMLGRVAPSLYIGPQLQVEYVNGHDIHNPMLWNGMATHTFTDGAGFAAVYDTRDHLTNAYTGVYIRLDQMFYPKFTGNRYAFSSTELTACHYRPLWRGCVMASQIHTRLTYGDTPWGLMSQLGGSYSMRGYYEGRYNDKCCFDLTVELRQRVWRRNGVVLWAGVGEVFPKLSEIEARRLLPNFGIGYRWEFKERVNVRLDFRHRQTSIRILVQHQ